MFEPPAGSWPRGCEGSFSPQASCTCRKSILCDTEFLSVGGLSILKTSNSFSSFQGFGLEAKAELSLPLSKKNEQTCKDAFSSAWLSIELEDCDFSLEWGRCGWPWAEMRLHNNGTIVGAAGEGAECGSNAVVLLLVAFCLVITALGAAPGCC